MNNLTKEQIQNMSYEEFDKIIRKVHDKRIHKKTSTYHSKYIIRDMRKEYKYIYQINETVAFKIIKRCLELLVDRMVFGGKPISLPYHFGRIYLIANKPNTYNPKTKKVACLVLDWQKTMKNWYNEGQCTRTYQNKDIVNCWPVWRKTRYAYKNLMYYDILFERPLRRKIKESDLKNKLVYYEYK